MVQLKTYLLKQKEFYYNQLFYSYLFEFERLQQFYAYDYRKKKSYTSRAKQIFQSYDHNYRKKLAGQLLEYNRAVGCGKATEANIGKLSSKDSLIVVGGQQPVFMGGPLFMVFKIITIIKLSECLKQELGIEVIPCFWNATDDSNISQVDSVYLDYPQKQELLVPGLPEDRRFSDLYLDQGQVENIKSQWEGKLPHTDFKPALLKLLLKSLHFVDSGRGVSFSRMFSSLVVELFSSRGLIIIDPSLSSIRKLSLDLVQKDLQLYHQAGLLAQKKGNILTNMGYHSQINPNPESLNFFLAQDGQREKVTVEKNCYKAGHKSYTREEFMAMIAKDNFRLSYNVMLRPMIQDTLFPVLATVCGPGEVSYFAQLKEVYELYGCEIPVIYPRFSATLVEKSVKKIKDKYGLGYQQFWQPAPILIKDIAARLMQQDISGLVSGLRQEITGSIENCQKSLDASLMDISSSFDRIKRNMEKETSVLEQKLFNQYKKQNQQLVQGIEKARQRLLPQGELQERKISMAGYLNKYGLGLVEELYQEFGCFDFGHKIIEIG